MDAPLQDHVPGAGSLGTDGHRRRPYPADVKGRFVTARRIVYAALIALWAALPWIPVGGHPAVFLDIDARQFFLFGLSFNAQDLWLLFFAVSGFGFALLFVTAVLGRVWCGWACPQTVFIEGLFRPIERAINGPRNVALRRAKEPFGWARLWRGAVTHGLYVVAALFVAHVFVAYFVSLPRLFAMVRQNPGAHAEAFAWMLATTALFYVAFGVFREQFCVVMCPYGRLQSVLLDDDALVVGYDERRGEPRGKAKTAKGDCVDCRRCVVVCPTNIDIRDGLQLDCIACTACIDACDDVMIQLGRKPGLVRYDSQRGFRGEKKRILRPRIWGYSALLAIGAIVAAFAIRSRTPFEANLLRLPGPPYTLEASTIRDGYELHLVNKSAAPKTFTITSVPTAKLEFVIPIPSVTVESLGSRRIPFFVTLPAADYDGPLPFALHVVDGNVEHTVTATFLGARP